MLNWKGDILCANERENFNECRSSFSKISIQQKLPVMSQLQEAELQTLKHGGMLPSSADSKLSFSLTASAVLLSNFCSLTDTLIVL